MRITRGADKTFTLAARPTMEPSKWLLRFVKKENEDVYQLCLASAFTFEGSPVQLTFTETDTPTALDGEVTLSVGQWQMYVYEQTSTTNLNWTLADRLVMEVMVDVEGAEVPDPDPTDPCSGACPDLCELLSEDTDPLTSAACVTDDNAPAMGSILLQRDTYTPDLIVEHIGNAGKTAGVQALICTPCGDVEIIDQDNNVIDTVAAGGQYQVFVLDSINDATPYETVITINDN